MTQQHPAVPPPELIRQWMERTEYDEDTWFYESYIAEQAAQWGADQELEACINYFHEYDSSWGENSELITGLRSLRRPKPPSLKDKLKEAIYNENLGEALRLVEKLDDSL